MENNIDICCIGHITLDKIVTPSQEVNMPGGTSYYFSKGINALLRSSTATVDKPSYKLITSLAGKDMHIVDEMIQQGIDADVIVSKYTTFFENIYGENYDNRRQRVRTIADPFTVDKLTGISAQYIVLGSLLAHDLSIDVIKHLYGKGTLVVDAQGYLRDVKDEKVYPMDWADKLEALKYIDILKVNEHEAEIITGEKDYYAAAEKIASWGVKEVLLTLGSQGSIILADGKIYNIPAYSPTQLVDATGCGDTYVMGYIYKRSQGASIESAAHFAAAVSTLKLEHSGPFSGTEDEVNGIIDNNILSLYT